MAIGAAIGGALVSGMFSSNSQSSAQAHSNEQMQNKHQWQVADLKKAGLNPILAAGMPANASPSGATASMPDFGSTALAAKRLQSEIDKLDAEADFTKTKEKLLKPGADVSGAMSDVVTHPIAESFTGTARRLKDQVPALKSGIKKKGGIRDYFKDLYEVFYPPKSNVTGKRYKQ